MTLTELQQWILSSEGLREEFNLLTRRYVAGGLPLASAAPDVLQYEPDWTRLLLAASVLSAGDGVAQNDAALLVAHAGISADREDVIDASATLLTQLANQRAINLAERRRHLSSGLASRLGAVERILVARRDFEHSIYLAKGGKVDANKFQTAFWKDLSEADWVSATAPTASGKTYLVLRWLLSEFVAETTQLALVIAPTRALVSELERELLDLAVSHDLRNLRVASLPLSDLADRSRPTILVFTQERLHVFLNACKEAPAFDITVVDEVQKLGDGLRGVILQDAIERVTRGNPSGRTIFLSPQTENPEAALRDAPSGSTKRVTPSELSTVTQNLILAAQRPRDATRWNLGLLRGGEALELGELKLHAKPDTSIKRLSFIALAMGRSQVGTLVYANGAADAEKIAWQIFDGLSEVDGHSSDDELQQLSDFARDTVHPKFQLVELVKKGVAFHYGNMPSLLRSEIERLFREGKIRFLVCTSTLIEGVNLACRTIVVRGPRKGRGRPMGPHDFWNLAGRAGRWGQEFQGNIICVDVNRSELWPDGAPSKAKYPIQRETDSVLSRSGILLDYLNRRAGLTPQQIVSDLEQVAAYLLAWKAREGSILTSPSVMRLDEGLQSSLDAALGALLKEAGVDSALIARHPGVSAVALGKLLAYFRSRPGDVDELLPASPESDDALTRLIGIFHRINNFMYPAFTPPAAVPLHALVTHEWMRGLPLGQIIRRRIEYQERRGSTYKLPQVIRDTMSEVEEVARFRAPKYLAAYVDVLKQFLGERGLDSRSLDGLRLDLFLEFGVSTRTLLSLIGLGLSRTSAVAINDYLANDDLDERVVLERLKSRDWESLDVPAVVKREIGTVIERRLMAA